MTSSTFSINVTGGGGSGQMLSAEAFEYTGLTPSSTLDTWVANQSSGASLTSGTLTATSTNDLFFAISTFSASTTLSTGSGWNSGPSITNNSTNQALIMENVLSNGSVTTAATWTAGTSTPYDAILATFEIPLTGGYIASGTLDSQTFDTGVLAGAQLNSIVWQGNQPAGSTVSFQIAASNSASGPWNFVGPDGTAGTYFTGNPGVPISLVSTSNGYALFNGYRYFRYRTALATTNQVFTPLVTQVVVNWSP
jgi:hypothetical protein